MINSNLDNERMTGNFKGDYIENMDKLLVRKRERKEEKV